MLKKLILGVALLGAYATASANLITDYVLNESTNIVTDTRNNIEWLQWDYTANMSINIAMANVAGTYDGGGWQLASNVQMARLFNTFRFGQSEGYWNSDENTPQQRNTGSDGSTEDPNDPELKFVSLFGDTYSEYDVVNCAGFDCLQISAALFGRDLDMDLGYNFASVFDDHGQGGSWASQGENGGAIIGADGFAANRTRLGTGVALVRTVHANAPAVSILAILSMALLAFRRYKSQ